MSEILSLSGTILNSFNIVSLERVLVASATLLHSKTPKAVVISLNLSSPLAGIIELKGQLPYNATAFNAGGDILNYLGELSTEEITYIAGDCGVMANPYLPPIPSNLTTLEQLFVWAALELQKALLTQATPDIYKGYCGFNSVRGIADIQFNLPFDYIKYLGEQNLIASVSQLINSPPVIDPLPNPVNWLGDWNSATSYQATDAVQYQGSAYIAKTTNTTKQPDINPTDWDLWVERGADGYVGVDGKSAYQVALDNGFVGTENQWLASLQGEQGIQGIQGIQGEKGDKGDPGAGLSWWGDWNSATSYQANDAVSYQGSAWVAKVTNFNKQPNINPTDWDLWVSKGGQGDQGPQGDQGFQGPQGSQGVDGKSAYQVALDNGFVGTENQWLASLQGVQGIQGAQGPQGIQGPQGVAGQDAWNSTGTKTTTYTASNNEKIACSTSSGAWTLTLPTAGRVWIFDVIGTSSSTGFGANNLTIIPATGSGQTVMGDVTSYILDKGAISRILELVGTDWRVTNYGH